MSSLLSAAFITSPDAVFAREVRDGLTDPVQKTLPTRFLYDDVGSALFDAITALEEYGLTRADVRLIRENAGEIAALCPETEALVELGSGNGSKTRPLLDALTPAPVYRPVDLSGAALDACARELHGFTVQPIRAEFLAGLRKASAMRGNGRLLVAFLGSNIGNFERHAIPAFFRSVRECLEPGDRFLLGADLVKDIDQLILAYDDPAGVTAAFNRNLLARVNRQLGADFRLPRYAHEARWSSAERRIEMHLRARSEQLVRVEALDLTVCLNEGETIWTESSHKFETEELKSLAQPVGFSCIQTWTDSHWPFAEILFRAV